MFETAAEYRPTTPRALKKLLFVCNLKGFNKPFIAYITQM